MLTVPVLIAAFALMNITAFCIVAFDKRKAVVGNHTERTPEGLIFFLATAFGAVGVYAAMLIFRHKTKRWYFQLGIPLLFLQNLATIYLVQEFFKHQT